MTTTGRVARVLLDTPLPQLDHPFDYRVPDALNDAVSAGVRVTVPLRGGTRFCDGFVIERVENAEFPGELGDIASVVSPLPVLTSGTYKLARAVADRQAGSVIDVLRLAIPPRYVRAEKAYLTAKTAVPAATAEPGATAEPAATVETDTTVSLPPTITGFDNWKMTRGERYVVAVPAHVVQLSTSEWVPSWALTFAELAAISFARGESSILAVPDFRDIDFAEKALVSLGLSESLCRVDAKQSGQQRYLNYLRCLEDRACIVLGNRSAPLTPVHNLGLVALWDDGDESFCEPLAPYAHARDVALMRQQADGAALVFAGYTRSTEAQRLVSVGWAQPIEGSAGYMPDIRLTDQHTDEVDAHHARIPSAAMLAARAAAKLGPILLQVSSPGYSSALACASCRERARCNSCSGPLGASRKGAVPSCRWCGMLASTWTCPNCNKSIVKHLSPGSEGTADELGRVFPGVRVVIADGNHAIQNIDSTPALVIATPGAEPLADGGYRAVLLLDGERMRMRENLRVNEDVVRHWSNAAALAATDATVYLVGAGDELGAVMSGWNQTEFAKRELADRHALRLPPAVRVVSVSGPLADVTATCATVATVDGTRVLGPIGTGEGNSRALLTFDYRNGEIIATALRASVIQSATKGSRRTKRPDQPKRVLRLRTRFDDTDIDSL
jgi:primosomal protein N' (replication factor Y)